MFYAVICVAFTKFSKWSRHGQKRDKYKPCSKTAFKPKLPQFGDNFNQYFLR